MSVEVNISRYFRIYHTRTAICIMYSYDNDIGLCKLGSECSLSLGGRMDVLINLLVHLFINCRILKVALKDFKIS